MSLLFASLFEQFFESGLVSHAADGSLWIHSAPERYVAWVVAFMVAAPLSGWCWRRRIGGRFAPGIFIASFFVPLIVVPGMALESIHASPDSLSIRTGLWFAPKIDEVPLSGVESISERVEAVEQRAFPRHDTFWYVRYRSGNERRINLTDLFEGNRTVVAEYLRQHGIEIFNGQEGVTTWQ